MEYPTKAIYCESSQREQPSKWSAARQSSLVICRNLSLALLLASSLPVAAEIYKYVDEKGATHYTSEVPKKPGLKFTIPDLADGPVTEADKARGRAEASRDKAAAKEITNREEAKRQQDAANRAPAPTDERAVKCAQARTDVKHWAKVVFDGTGVMTYAQDRHFAAIGETRKYCPTS